MSHEFLDFVEDILDAMDKAKVLVEGFTYSHSQTKGVVHPVSEGASFFVLRILNAIITNA
jgi:hypothetical protein